MVAQQFQRVSANDSDRLMAVLFCQKQFNDWLLFRAPEITIYYTVIKASLSLGQHKGTLTINQ